MKHKFRISLMARINTLCFTIILCFSLVFVWIYKEVKAKMYDLKAEKTRHVVETVYGIPDFFYQQAEQGIISLEAAKSMSKEIIRHLRYEGIEYLWINDSTGFMVMHPIEAANLDQTNQITLEDANGKLIIKSFVDICKQYGEGMVDYYWPKPGRAGPEPKISYVKLFPQWDWIIGTGIYVDDVEQQIRHGAKSIIIVLSLFICLVFILSVKLSKSIAVRVFRVARGIMSGAEQVAAASEETSSTSQELTASTNELAASIEESSASLEEMSAMIQETTQLTRGADTLMNQNIERSASSLTSLIELMQIMSGVETDSAEMERIIKMIDEIAFQTNLLSLNAAVEAARAGESGAGFAVVADEVRNLALRTASAANDTQNLLSNTVNQIRQALTSIHKINEDFNTIVESATMIGEKTSSITSASNEHSKGIEHISIAMNEMEKVTHSVAASSEQTAASSEELSAQAMDMKHHVRELMITIRGSKSSKLFDM